MLPICHESAHVHPSKGRFILKDTLGAWKVDLHRYTSQVKRPKETFYNIILALSSEETFWPIEMIESAGGQQDETGKCVFN